MSISHRLFYAIYTNDPEQIEADGFIIYTGIPIETAIMKNRITPDQITQLEPGQIFVFGSNGSGYHGGGAARLAFMKWGAQWGKGTGLYGRTYAIPTMQGGVETIRPYVDEFIDFARNHPELTFLVTEIGCGIAGFTPQQIAPLFIKATNESNIWLPRRFWEVLQTR